jgi:uncharacterized membrane protein YkoI
MSRKFIAILILVIIIVVLITTFAGFMNQQPNIKVNNTKVYNQSKTTITNDTFITPQEAQDIAQKYIAEPNATAGTPKLLNESNGWIYVVPVVINNKTVGEIEIDAHTGENLGGSGG